MAGGIVQALEQVDIGHDEGDAGFRDRRVAPQAVDAVGGRTAVAEPGERVARRQDFQLLIGALQRVAAVLVAQ